VRLTFLTIQFGGACFTGNILREEGPGLVLKDLSVATPNARNILYRDLSLQLAPGDSLLVMGPSGCGKSSLLRAIAGLWNRGSGILQSPPHADTFFLPQKPYMPLGSLREQLIFPSTLSSLSPSNVISDTELLKTLQEVSLEDLPTRVGGLGAEKDWSDHLSSGEQQRLAFARLLLHSPKVAFLDEASSALDTGNEARLYSLLSQRIETYVSVGHRISLVKFHTFVLEFKDDNSWRFCRATDFGTP
jgi:putative ATP-binding cassette transporter